ncbi:MAG: DMT family transporter [Bacilli bacterium]|nr:DMT family transporter [Bacilli bacterium]
MSKQKITGFISLVFTIIIWGITFLATETLLNDFTPIEILFFRFGLSLIALFLVYHKIFKWQGWKVELLCFLASLFGMSIYQSLENYAIQYANASMVSIIIATASFFTVIFSRIILKEKNIKINFYIGLIIGIVGISLVILNGNALSIEPLGDFIALLCSVLWGLYSVVVELINKYKLNMLQITRRITMYGFLILIPMFFISGGKFDLVRFTKPENLIWMIYLGILASAICFYTWNYSVDKLGPVPTSIGILVQPIVTVVVGVIWFNHKFTWVGIVGLAVTIIGLYVALFLSPKKQVDKRIIGGSETVDE